jgi:hypothetical protein
MNAQGSRRPFLDKFRIAEHARRIQETAAVAIAEEATRNLCLNQKDFKIGHDPAAPSAASQYSPMILAATCQYLHALRYRFARRDTRENAARNQSVILGGVFPQLVKQESGIAGLNFKEQLRRHLVVEVECSRGVWIAD